jgi:uncharacterized protein YbbK (DUF523 family)
MLYISLLHCGKRREEKMNVIVSACLLGINCRYDGSSAFSAKIVEFLKKKKLNPIPVCPEQLGGLPTPRKRCEIADGFAVLRGESKVYTKDGEDLTSFFLRGAEETLKIAEIVNARKAILKLLSPSCGAGKIYDGTFLSREKNGYGVTAALLKLRGIEVLSENLIDFHGCERD